MRGEAAAKAILFGEHAVVHGVAAIAVPVPARRTDVEAIPLESSREIEIELAAGATDAGAVDLRIARDMVRLALDQGPAPAPRGARVRVRSTIPLGSGLGSSAAFAVALVRALGGAALPIEEVARRAIDLEKLAHGTTSGIDPTVIAFDRPIIFRRGEAPAPLAVGAPLRFVAAVLPREGTTASLVGGVRRLAEAEPERFRRLMAAISETAAIGRGYLERGAVEMAGIALSTNHMWLRELGVSTRALDDACEAACRAGALGAKLSGAGGGGAAIALLPPEGDARPVLEAFRAAGARDVFAFDVAPGAARP